MGLDRRTPSTEALAAAARSLLAQTGVQQTLERICVLAVESIDGCDHAGISFLRDGQVTTPAASGCVPGAVDAIQYETGEGPCLDAMRTDEVFVTDDLARERRWPHFSARAHRETGVTSMLSFRLFVADDTLGALNLYAESPAAFDQESQATGIAFAAHAAVALSTAIHEEQMDQALQSRDLIGQAKGLIMAREGVDADEAFKILRRASQRLNVKLRVLAQSMVDASPRSEGPAPAAGETHGGGA